MPVLLIAMAFFLVFEVANFGRDSTVPTVSDKTVNPQRENRGDPPDVPDRQANGYSGNSISTANEGDSVKARKFIDYAMAVASYAENNSGLSVSGPGCPWNPVLPTKPGFVPDPNWNCQAIVNGQSETVVVTAPSDPGEIFPAEWDAEGQWTVGVTNASGTLLSSSGFPDNISIVPGAVLSPNQIVMEFTFIF